MLLCDTQRLLKAVLIFLELRSHCLNMFHRREGSICIQLEELRLIDVHLSMTVANLIHFEVNIMGCFYGMHSMCILLNEFISYKFIAPYFFMIPSWIIKGLALNPTF